MSVSGTKEINFRVRLESGKKLRLAVRNIVADSYSDMLYLALGIAESFLYDVFSKIEGYKILDHDTDCDYFYDYLSQIQGWQDGNGFITSYRGRKSYVDIEKLREETKKLR